VVEQDQQDRVPDEYSNERGAKALPERDEAEADECEEGADEHEHGEEPRGHASHSVQRDH
jgi:hypothetical protein